ncbi:hypothetical protein Trydic_g18196, partial [Trypoxylus dichotomus]
MCFDNFDEQTLRELIHMVMELYQTKFGNASTNPQPIATQNRFELLSDNEEEAEEMEEDLTEETSEHKETEQPSTSGRSKNEGTTAAKPVRKQKIAPIIIKETAKWTRTANLMREKRITATKSKLINTGIQVEPATEEYYRKLMVLRGITQDITEEEIKHDLHAQDYPVEKITRMKGKGIEIGRLYKSIYNITDCCGLAVKVEALRTRNLIVQCHKCQMFGHTQSNCNINYKCMKCGEDHSTHLCEKPKTTPPKCANCGGEHLSTYPENPNNAVGKKFIDAPLPKNNPWNKKKDNGPSNTQPPKEEPKKTTVNKPEDKLALNLWRMLLNFNNTNATVEQRMEFLRQTEELTALYKNIPNYAIYRTDRSSGPGGGTAVLVRNNVKHHQVATRTIEMETTAVQIHTARGVVEIHSCYGPP